MADDKKMQVATKEDIEKNKTNAILSYLGILIIVPLISEDAKKSPFAKFHMNQGLVLILASFVSIIPILGWILGIGVFVLWVIGILGAINGEMKKVPLLGDIQLIK